MPLTLSPAITHTRRCAAVVSATCRACLPLPPRSSDRLASQAAHPTVCAGLCAAQTNTVGPARGGTGDGRKAAQHVLLRSGGAGAGFPRDPACPQPTTAWRTLPRTIPSETQAHRHPRRPHCVVYTPVPSPLYPLAPLPTHGSKHAVQGRLATPQTPPSIIHPCVPVRTGTSLSIPPVTTCRTYAAGAYIGRQESCRQS